MINTKNIVEMFSLAPGMKVADFGSGAGHFTVAMAKHVGNGVVYAFDVQKEALSALRSRASSEHISNIETNQVDLEAANGTGLSDQMIDLVLISNMLFQLEDKPAVAQEAWRVLKPEGKVIVIDWKAGTPLGPLSEMRVKKENVAEIFEKIGFKLKSEFEAGDSHYGLMFTKHG